MCGFVGFTGSIEDGGAIGRMMDKIKHRGPDSGGLYADTAVTLGFRRLSIIDVSESGDQPIFNEDKSVVVMLNGEIYNYKALRAELEGQGHTFYTRSDTETLAHLYEQHGAAMVQKLRGMFAFVVYDKTDGSVFIARDYFGIKPMYYGQFGGHVLFGSEIKAFLPFPAFKKELNEAALEQYLSFQYSALNETFFKGVYKLPPGHYMTIKGGDVSVTRYFEPTFEAAPQSEDSAVNNIEAAVLDSVRAHMVADVEVGSFLSSGVDSSFVAATFKGDKTFTVGFDYEKYNEIEYAKSLSQTIQIQNFSELISTERYWAALPRVQYHMDEPLADPSAVALYFVAQLAAKHVKVALSGEGADEFFGGYNVYREPTDLRRFTRFAPRWFWRAMSKAAAALPFKFYGKNFLIRAGKTVEGRFLGGANVFTQAERNKILKRATQPAPQAVTKPIYARAAAYDDVTKMQRLDMEMWLVGDILLKADKMSMAHSIEVRVPFLDKLVFAVARALPTNLRVGKTDTKHAFRMAARRHLPIATADKKKLGFPVPIRVWLKEDAYYSQVKAAFESEAAARYFHTRALVALLDGHRRGKADNSRKIWAVYMFLVWHDQFFKQEALS